MRTVDFHTHILPGIDDGAADVETARKLLCSQKQQGVDVVVATPHCYKHQSYRAFVEKREKALQQVMESGGEDFPEIILGAEVELYCGLSERQNVRKLCIENTDYMLIEMPFTYWNDWFYDELDLLESRHGIKPIIAHLDRYIPGSAQIRYFHKMLERDALIQINAGALLRFGDRQVVKKLLAQNAFTVLGTDCHDLKKRNCNFNAARRVLQSRFKGNLFEKLMENADRILQNQPVGRKLD
ncbi:MAG: hypothetical protein IKW06_03655 [Clostridia bacterium]|nr:hypothetical protein [Clostridia bacterium]